MNNKGFSQLLTRHVIFIRMNTIFEEKGSNFTMKITKIFIIAIVLTLILAACGEDDANNGRPQMIDVQISTEPDMLMPGEPVKIIAKVTLQDENVEDADEVLFEIWEDGHKEE